MHFSQPGRQQAGPAQGDVDPGLAQQRDQGRGDDACTACACLLRSWCLHGVLRLAQVMMPARRAHVCSGKAQEAESSQEQAGGRDLAAVPCLCHLLGLRA